MDVKNLPYLALTAVLAAALPAQSAELAIDDGVVVKFGDQAGLVVRDRLVIDGEVVFTALEDGAVGGETVAGNGEDPQPGAWGGVRVEPAVGVDDLVIDGLQLRFAGQAGQAGLDLARNDYLIRNLDVRDSLIGLRIRAGGSLHVDGARFRDNQIGVKVSGGATPRFTHSEFSGSTEFAILNLDPAHVVDALGNWWGSPFGPFHPSTNESSPGDRVSDGVLYDDYATRAPLQGCSSVSANGNYQVEIPFIHLVHDCPGAVQMRASENPAFPDAAWQAFGSVSDFELSLTAGARAVHVQFRGPSGRTVAVQLPEPVELVPGQPAVALALPAVGMQIAASTPVRAQVTHGVPLERVTLRSHDRILAEFPGPLLSWDDFDASFPVDAMLADGAYPVTAEAIDVLGSDPGRAERVVVVSRLDAEGRHHGPPYVWENAQGDTAPVPNADAAVQAWWADYQARWERPDCSYAVVPVDPWANQGVVADLQVSEGCPAGGQVTATLRDADIRFVSPAEGAILRNPVTVQVQAAAEARIDRVDFLLGEALLGQSSSSPYRLTLRPIEQEAGVHILQAVVHATGGAQIHRSLVVEIAHPEPDLTPPEISEVRFAGDLLEIETATRLTAPGVLSFRATDNRAIASVGVTLDGVSYPPSLQSGFYRVFLPLDQLEEVPDDTYDLVITATDSSNNVTSLDLLIEVDVPQPEPPRVENPQAGQVLRSASVLVSGSAVPGATVQLHLDGTPVGATTEAGPEGNFSQRIDLGTTEDRDFVLAAEAINGKGTSGPGAGIPFRHEAAGPAVSLMQPVANARVEDDVLVLATASDPTGIKRFVARIDGEVLVETTTSPLERVWEIDDVDNGSYTLVVEAESHGGKTTTIERTIIVDRYIEPPPVITPYVGVLDAVDAIVPTLSYGGRPIRIRGKAVDAKSSEPIPNALLQLVLEVNGFQRRINVTSDDTGRFNFVFQPQASDAGTYRVMARHPEQTAFHSQGQFTINRLEVRPQRVNLSAAHGIPTVLQVELRASAGSGTQGVRVEVDPEFPLPPNIQVQTSDRVDLAAGETRRVPVTVTGASATDGNTGQFRLVARSQDAANEVRGHVLVNYQLSAPQPALRPAPTYMHTGVSKGASATESIRIENRGLAAATDLGVRLRTEGGGPVPDWVAISSQQALGRLGVGESVSVDVTAMPDELVPDGVHRFWLVVEGSNAQMGEVPVTIDVTESGVGEVEFHVANIYTETIDEDTGLPIPGLAGARVQIEHESIPTLRFNTTSDGDGLATLVDVPAGRYTYRVSSGSHSPESGRLVVRPGGRTREDVFLDYVAISFEWSVVETTIQDRYDVVLEAVFQTRIPAPVVVVRPAAINIPDLQIGEEFTGEITVTNYGLIRADEVNLQLPDSGIYYDIQFLGEVPESLEALEQVKIPYRVRALLPLPSMREPVSQARDPIGWALQSIVASSVSCWHYSLSFSLGYKFECVNGEWRISQTGGGFHKTYGSTCSADRPPISVGPGGPGGGVGSWSGSVGRAATYSLPLVPDCFPNGLNPCAPGAAGGSGSSAEGGGR